jgi:hypothetical protein
MKEIIAFAALTLVLAVGTSAVMIIHSQPALVCNGNNC